MKEILLRLEEGDHRVLEWISEKLGLSKSECLRSFIPRVSLPEVKMLGEESEIATASSRDLVPVKGELGEDDLMELDAILNELKERGWAVTLAKEIHHQIIENKATQKYLTAGTYKRLSRWGEPYRWSVREQFVKPRAEKISEILFGHTIKRVNQQSLTSVEEKGR